MVTCVKDNTIRRTICSKCRSVLEYHCKNDPFCDDIQYNEKLHASIYSWYIKCPQCQAKIKIEERASKT